MKLKVTFYIFFFCNSVLTSACTFIVVELASVLLHIAYKLWTESYCNVSVYRKIPLWE